MYEAVPQVQRTKTACAGAATAYVLRHTAATLGRYMIDVQNRIIDELGLDAHGTSLPTVENWLRLHASSLRQYGLREAGVVQISTSTLIKWIEQGGGRRGAVVATRLSVLYPNEGVDGPHAVALTYSTQEDTGSLGVILVDPWPGHTTEQSPPPTLDAARMTFGHVALLIEWS